MIAPVKQRRFRKSAPAWHAAFLAMLPAIVRHARISFQGLDAEAKQEVVANCLVAYVRLVELGKASVAYPTVLARFAVAQVRDGRRVGTKLNVRDVLSEYAQRAKGFMVDRLDHYDQEEGAWREILIADRTATPADVAASRIDFPAWLGTLERRNRRIAQALAVGHTTSEVSRRFSLSPARISQLRSQLRDSWHAFVDEDGGVNRPAAATA